MSVGESWTVRSSDCAWRCGMLSAVAQLAASRLIRIESFMVPVELWVSCCETVSTLYGVLADCMSRFELAKVG